jgi:hypothetical protein
MVAVSKGVRRLAAGGLPWLVAGTAAPSAADARRPLCAAPIQAGPRSSRTRLQHHMRDQGANAPDTDGISTPVKDPLSRRRPGTSEKDNART